MYSPKVQNPDKNVELTNIVIGEQIEDLDFDPMSYGIALSVLHNQKCKSRKVSKKLGKTPDRYATDLRFKKKRHEEVVKSRKATKVYQEYTQWSL